MQPTSQKALCLLLCLPLLAFFLAPLPFVPLLLAIQPTFPKIAIVTVRADFYAYLLSCSAIGDYHIR